MLEYFRVALLGLQSNKTRSALTMLGVTIGVAAVVLLVSLGQAVERFILDQFSYLGSDLVYVFGTIDERTMTTKLLTESDAEALANFYGVPDAVCVMPMVEVNGDFGLPVAYQGKQFTSRIHGATTDYLLMFNRTVVEGRFYTEEEVLSGARVAVIGPSIVENLFADVYPLGKEIRIDNLTLHVIGILNDAGVSGFGMQADMDALVLTPITTAQMRLMGDKTVSGERPVSAIMLKARDDDSVELVAHQARLTLRDAHHILFRDEDDFEIVTQQDLLVSVGSIMSILTVFLGVIAGVSLLVGGIGIMNIMLVTVTERTHEIGLRKAVGAQKFAILLQFLTEAMVLAVMGGLIGVSIALGLAYLVSQAGVGLDVQVQVSSILLATSISIMIGVFFGLYPARRAANLNPIDALRYE